MPTRRDMQPSRGDVVLAGEPDVFKRGEGTALEAANGKLGPLTSFRVDVSRDEQHDKTPNLYWALYTMASEMGEFVHCLHINLGQHG